MMRKYHVRFGGGPMEKELRKPPRQRPTPLNGRTASWFPGAQVRHEGRIWAGGVEKDVTFVDADHDIDEELDAAYRTKYRRYAASIISHIVSPEARSATIKLLPRSASS
jgi:hypothetical protein